MTTLPLPTGPTNKQLIDRAYDMMGMSGEVFGRPVDEYTLGQRTLNAMMEEWPFNLMGYIGADYGDGDLEEKSGIASKYREGVSAELAMRLAPAKGKTLAPAMIRTLNRASAIVYADFSVPAQVEFPQGTISGNGRYSPFLATDD